MSLDVFSLQDRVAIVTGGASGLGRRIVGVLASAGASVAVADLDRANGQAVAEEQVRYGRHVTYIPMDVTQPEAVERAVDQLVSMQKRLDIGVNAAGVSGGRPTDKTAYDVWRYVIETDLSGVYYCCVEYAKVMKEQQCGTIINIASMSATVVNHFPQSAVEESYLQGVPAYCAAKAGVKQLTKALAAQWARYGIRVNCISPGYMQTKMTEAILSIPGVCETIIEDTPLRRVGQPCDLDGLVLYLSSDASEFMTGSEVIIDGGYTIW